MNQHAAIRQQFLKCLRDSQVNTTPYRHWLLRETLPADACDDIVGLPFAPPPIEDTKGKRETNNSTRTFFNPESRARFPVCEGVAQTMQSREVVEALEQTCGLDLTGTLLRIEYCLDTDGFWLEPHTDIGAKKFTMLFYLSSGPGAETLGTDIYDADKRLLGSAPAPFNSGLIFVPGTDTWHGFERKPIHGVRRSIIVNYVIDEWRSRHELAFPESPIGRA